jgi:hypothetical protein
MNIDNFYLIKCHDPVDAEDSQLISCFSTQDLSNNYLWSAQVMDYSDYLEKLVFRIARKPNRLVTHVQRILYCFHADLNEQLFAAIVDFLVILNRRGNAISQRMVIGSRSRLKPWQLRILKSYLLDPNYDANLLSGNQYSIFTKGMLGASNLIMMPKNHYESSYDPLELAYDHIEYSQLEQAKQVLEEGILNDPDRLVLHNELLMLYQSTGDVAGFKQMYSKLTQLGFPIPEKWAGLTTYFEKASSNG